VIERQRIVAGQHPIVMSRDCSLLVLILELSFQAADGRHMRTTADLSFSFLFGSVFISPILRSNSLEACLIFFRSSNTSLNHFYVKTR
jgi:hypothetical protein